MAFDPTPDVQTVSPAELAKQADQKFTEARVEFFDNAPTEGRLMDLIKLGEIAIKREKAASPIGGLKNKGWKTLDFWEVAYEKALSDRPNALKIVTDQIAGMAVADVLELQKQAKRSINPLGWFNQVIATQPRDLLAVAEGIGEHGQIPRSFIEKLISGIAVASDWKDNTLRAAQERVDKVRRNADLTVKMVEAKTKAMV